MKLTFEGKILADIIQEMEDVLATIALNTRQALPLASASTASDAKPQGQGPGPVPQPKVKAQKASTSELPVEIPAEKPVDPRIAKMQAAKAAKKAAREAEAVAAVETKLNAPQEAKPPIAPSTPEPEPTDIFEEPEPPVDPVEIVKIRQKTIEDLQAAYANGHQKEVFVLLSLHGNGAKSFRELPPEAFLPIRKAIDNGALEGAQT